MNSSIKRGNKSAFNHMVVTTFCKTLKAKVLLFNWTLDFFFYVLSTYNFLIYNYLKTFSAPVVCHTNCAGWKFPLSSVSLLWGISSLIISRYKTFYFKHPQRSFFFHNYLKELSYCMSFDVKKKKGKVMFLPYFLLQDLFFSFFLSQFNC